MKIAFITDPLQDFNLKKDSTFLMMLAAKCKGYEVSNFELKDIFLRDSNIYARFKTISLTGDKLNWFKIIKEGIESLNYFDFVIMRKDPPFNMEYLYSTYLLELAERKGAKVINSPSGLRNFNEKLAISFFPNFSPLTIVTKSIQIIKEFIIEEKVVIVKPLDEMGGSSIFKVGYNDPNLNVILENMTIRGNKTVMVQKFLPEIKDGDKRILLIDGEPMPYILNRIPKKNEIRANLAAGGTAISRKINKAERDISAEVGEKLKRYGLYLIGLDMIGNFITEINLTSPTCMQEILKQSNYNVADIFIKNLSQKK